MEDLFDSIEILPEKVKKAIENFETSDLSYVACQRLVHDLELLGYTCEYGLDACPYNLREIN